MSQRGSQLKNSCYQLTGGLAGILGENDSVCLAGSAGKGIWTDWRGKSGTAPDPAPSCPLPTHGPAWSSVPACRADFGRPPGIQDTAATFSGTPGAYSYPHARGPCLPRKHPHPIPTSSPRSKPTPGACGGRKCGGGRGPDQEVLRLAGTGRQAGTVQAICLAGSAEGPSCRSRSTRQVAIQAFPGSGLHHLKGHPIADQSPMYSALPCGQLSSASKNWWPKLQI